MMPLKNGSMSYMGWVGGVRGALFIRFWLWNVTNPDEVKSGMKPKLKEIGPFVFEQVRNKHDIEFFPNKTVGSRTIKTYYYQPQMSYKDGNMSDVIITTVNIPYLTTAVKTKQVSVLIRTIINRFFTTHEGGLFITKTAQEILLGYEDQALKNAAPMAKFVKGIIMPKIIGLFANQNNTPSGYYLAHTGEGDLSQFNQLKRYENRTDLSVWPEAWANRIEGTDGSMFHPGVKTDESLKIFSQEICRSIYITYKQPAVVHGIDVLQFSVPEEIFANASVNPKNKAFCTPNCMEAGVLNISSCREGAPMAISSPHFYGGSDRYINAIDGLSPDHRFKTLIHIEPRTGFVVKANRMMQINAVIERIPGYPDLQNIDQLVMPLMWLNESGGIDAERAALFRGHLIRPIQIVGYSQYGFIALGLVIALIVFSCIFFIGCLKSTGDTKLSGLPNHFENHYENGMDVGKLYRPIQEPIPKDTKNGHEMKVTKGQEMKPSSPHDFNFYNSNGSLNGGIDAEHLEKLLANASRESDIF